MEWSITTIQVFIAAIFISGCLAVPLRTNFEKCDYKGFTCTNSKTVTGKLDVVFQCNTTITTQDVLIYLWHFNSPAAIISFTIQNCDKVQLAFSCSPENKPMQWLKVQNVGVLELLPSTFTHNPPEIYFENIQTIENIPRNTFAQIKYDSYKPGCFNPLLDLNIIDFNNVSIGNIETEAFRNVSYMKGFTWNNVLVHRVSTGAVKLHFENEAGAQLKRCSFGILEPLAFHVVGDTFSITNGKFSDIWGSGVNGTVFDFHFNNNSVANTQSGAFSILAQNVYILDNHFESIESGAFQKISPGLLIDSKRNFGKMHFVYKFSNNLVENVENGGVRPDVEAYNTVATNIAYSSNTLQCSCEGLSWHGADINLGFGYSVIKDFSSVVMDSQHRNQCTLTPCMCFSVKPPSKKSSPRCCNDLKD